MSFKSVVVSALLGAGLVFGTGVSAFAHDDIDEMTDEELVEAEEGIQEGLAEIEESRAEIAEQLAEEDIGHIEGAALEIADKALDGVEEVLEEVLEEIDEEQASRE